MAEPRLALLTGDVVSSLSTADLPLTEAADLSLAGVEAAIGISGTVLSSSSVGNSLDCSSLTGFSLLLVVSVDDSGGIVGGVVVVSGPTTTEL